MAKKARRGRSGRLQKPADGGERTVGSKAAFPVVGIGASAGGLEALERLLKATPADTGMAFLIVQHLDPKHESRLSAILSRATSMPVTEAKDRMKIVRNHVYIIPPNTSMFVRDSMLRLEPRQPGAEMHLPVDSLLRSLGAAHRNRAVGVILSGTASDGAAGMRAIKNEGGITFAQDADSARYYGMPGASIASGVVDFVMPPEEIATSLARIGRHPHLTLTEVQVANEKAPPPAAMEKPAPMKRLFQLLRKSFGVDFAAYKPSTIGRRIRRRMAIHGINDISEYVRHVGENADELRTLYHDMFIGVTGFFREPEAFEVLKKKVFPRLCKDRSVDAPIRVWVPGCSTGEEVYSLAIALLEFRLASGSNTSIQMFGTDVNDEAIKKARIGRYEADIASEVGKKRFQRFFVKSDQGYQVSQAVRDMCVFAKHDILRDPPFSRLDLVSCRNVLIYLDTAAQHKLLPLFHYTLKPSGFLMLGSAETIGNFADLFDLVERRNKIYAKRSTVDRPRLDWLAERQHMSDPAEPRPEHLTRSDFELQKDAADLIILNEHAPAAVLVNEDMEILHFRGHTGAYLEPSPGVASLNLMKMAREGLVGGLRTAIQKARRKNAPAVVAGLRVDANGDEKTIDLRVVPVKTPKSHDRTFLVIFRDTGEHVVKLPSGRRKAIVERTSDQRLSQLKHELTTTKAYLQSVIENQDAANEELRSLNEEQLSTNEELQSTTEELETANEELQSANEELITLNDELEHRNRDLAEAHNDILNLLNSLSLSIIIVDRDLRIRRLTATALNELHLLPGDVGRSLKHIRLPVDIPDLDAVVKEVLGKPSVVRRELVDHDQRWRQVQFNSYVTADGKVEGAILSMTDVHDAKLAEERFWLMVDSAADAMVISDMEGRIRLVNAQAEQLFGYGRDELIGKMIGQLVPVPKSEIHRASYGQDLGARGMGRNLQLVAHQKQGRQIPIEVNLSPMPAREGTLVSATIRDVTQRKKAELETRRFAVLAERGLARDVHDNLAQGLAGIVVHLEGAEDILESNPREAMRQIGQARDLARSTLEQARRSLLALRPEILEETDLAGSLERVAGGMTEGTKIEARVTVHGERASLPVEIEENLLRIGQEALANAVKHAKPAQVVVELRYEPGRVRLSVIDDGDGFAALDRGRASGLGVAIMKGRAASIGGLLNIRSQPGDGTQVEAVVPTPGHSGKGIEI